MSHITRILRWKECKIEEFLALRLGLVSVSVLGRVRPTLIKGEHYKETGIEIVPIVINKQNFILMNLPYFHGGKPRRLVHFTFSRVTEFGIFVSSPKDKKENWSIFGTLKPETRIFTLNKLKLGIFMLRKALNLHVTIEFNWWKLKFPNVFFREIWISAALWVRKLVSFVVYDFNYPKWVSPGSHRKKNSTNDKFSDLKWF